MQWSVTADPVRSIEIYRMFVPGPMGKMQAYQGAVLFGPSRQHGCEVIRIFTPMPDSETFYETLSKAHAGRLRERLVFLDMDKTDVMHAIQSFCHQGLPLPDLFDDGTARLEGLTVFQLASYQVACDIPHGETRSYAWLAVRLKRYGAERAVGGAMRANPFPLFIPCHRVVNKDGNLGGFMGTNAPESWQMGVKRTLLEIESLHRQPSLFASPIEFATKEVH